MRIKAMLPAAAAIALAIGILSSAQGNTAVATAACNIQTGGTAINKMSVYKSSASVSQDYLIGVVAAEMPASYGDEALKAQAVASRTYALRAMENNPDLPCSQIGQAYISNEVMQSRWGDSYTAYYNKIKAAVQATDGIIITYNNAPILAAFCASSGGTTEDSRNVWGEALPYLVSVDSSWDEQGKDFSTTTALPLSSVVSILGGVPEIQTRTQAGYVQSAYAGGKYLTGIQIRQLLGLKSACFQVAVTGDTVYFTTKGYGHGVGMSQVGAGAMADSGSSFEEILAHYYPGTQLTRCN